MTRIEDGRIAATAGHDLAARLDLPEGWRAATIPELVGREGLFSDGDWVESKDQDPNGDVRLIQLADVGDGEFRNKSARFLTSGKANELSCTFLRRGDILIARMPEPLGRACIFPGDPKPAVTAVDVCIVRPRPDSVASTWLLYTVNSPQFRSSITQFERGTTRRRISRANLARIPFPVPPLAEQRRIMAKVEELLGRVNAARERLAHVPTVLKRFRQAVLAAACSGRLTEECREDEPTQSVGRFPQAWRLAAVEEVVSEPLANRRSVPDATSGFPVLRLTALKKGRVDLSERKIGKWTHEEARRFLVSRGDFLVARGNGSLNLVGRGGLVDCEPDRVAYPDTLIRVRPNRRVLSSGFALFEG